MKLIAVCVTPHPTFTNPLSPIQLVTWPSDEIAAPRGTVERVRLIARLRNEAVAKALQFNPSHILMVDDYYLGQAKQINRLVAKYERLQHQGLILGASTWIRVRQNTVLVKTRFYDFGTTPEARKERFAASGLMKVKAVGACYIFPIEAWYKNKYICNFDHFEPEHISLCRGFDTLLDLDVKLWRHDRIDAILPVRQTARIAFGRWRRKLCAN